MNLLATNITTARTTNKTIALSDLFVSSCCMKEDLLSPPQAAHI